MSLGDVFFVIVRWLHLSSAVVWIGGSVFYLLVLRPTADRYPDEARIMSKTLAGQFRVLVDISIIVLVATGAIEAFDRLAEGVVGPDYVITLAIKVALSVWMFLLVQRERRRAAMLIPYLSNPPKHRNPVHMIGNLILGYNGIAIAGAIIFLLSDVLRSLYEATLRGQ